MTAEAPTGAGTPARLRAHATALAPKYRDMGRDAGREIKGEWEAVPPTRRRTGLAALAMGTAAFAIGIGIAYASSPELRKTIRTHAAKIRREVVDDVRSFLDPSSQQAGEQASGAARTEPGHEEPAGAAADTGDSRQTRELATTSIT